MSSASVQFSLLSCFSSVCLHMLWCLVSVSHSVCLHIAHILIYNINSLFKHNKNFTLVKLLMLSLCKHGTAKICSALNLLKRVLYCKELESIMQLTLDVVTLITASLLVRPMTNTSLLTLISFYCITSTINDSTKKSGSQ